MLCFLSLSPFFRGEVLDPKIRSFFKFEFQHFSLKCLSCYPYQNCVTLFCNLVMWNENSKRLNILTILITFANKVTFHQSIVTHGLTYIIMRAFTSHREKCHKKNKRQRTTNSRYKIAKNVFVRSMNVQNQIFIFFEPITMHTVCVYGKVKKKNVQWRMD